MKIKKMNTSFTVLFITGIIFITGLGGMIVYAFSGNQASESQGNENNVMAFTVPSPVPVYEEVDANSANTFYAEHETNSNGQTYGSSSVAIENLAPGTVVVLPELIAAMGSNGKEGYVYCKDLEGEQPNNPEEAVEYMKRLEELNKQGLYTRIIPLYESDGITVIGEFEIGGMFFDSK